jgi:pyruvate dehydrogenase E1 component
MPDFWEFPTVSMGLGPINAIYQARFNRYLHEPRHQGHLRAARLGVPRRRRDGRARVARRLGLAAREELDNLTFVVNCNLQRLDGPVRGNGKIIQELESFFRGAGWNVIKVIWGREWDELLAATSTAPGQPDEHHADGEFQTYKAETAPTSASTSSAATRALRKMVEHLSDEEIWKLPRRPRLPQGLRGVQGGHEHKGQPTVILAKTIKGWTLGQRFEGRNATHQMKKLTADDLKAFRDRLYLPIPDEALETRPDLPPYYHPGPRTPTRSSTCSSGAARSAARCRAASSAPSRSSCPGQGYDRAEAGSGKQEVATTMAFVRLLKDLMKDKEIGPRFVPIIPDEARTFGMDSLFPTRRSTTRTASVRPGRPRADAVLQGVREGQILHEGINEAGSMASFTPPARRTPRTASR